ncbi:MAG: asparagine synthase (glutamine-hydrolyzing) [Thermoleophilia bacterium]
MCGIAGVALPGECVPPANRVWAMGEVMAHRGPDDAGIHVGPRIGLCSRRLSVVDCSSGGHQPMYNEDGTKCLILNGEIYNHAELRRSLQDQGHVFIGKSDTEVVLHAYEQYGQGCLGLFNGMFAIAIWDVLTNELFIARDRLGIKPLYYTSYANTIVFGSEIKSILAWLGTTPSVFYPAIHDYVDFGYPLSDDTWYSGIKQLLPGNCALWKDGVLRKSVYWKVNIEVVHGRSVDSWADELLSLLKDSIALNLRSDVGIGAHLSGGIDSSTVVALAADQLGKGLSTFSGAFPMGEAYDESEYARLVVDLFRTRHFRVFPEAKHLAASLPSIIWHLDEPVAGPGVFPQYEVSRLVKESGIKVVCGGQGGDEAFAGYQTYYWLAFQSLLSGLFRGLPVPKTELLSLFRYGIPGRTLKAMQRRVGGGQKPPWLRSPGHRDVEVFERRSVIFREIEHFAPFEKQTYLHLTRYLPALLHVEDRASMAWSVESRVPLLDHRIIQLATQAPSWIKVREGTLKYILRRSVRGIVPDQVLSRRDKMGFPTPIGVWFRRELNSWLRGILVDTQLRGGELLDSDVLGRMVDEHARGKADHSQALWKALNIELWSRQRYCGKPGSG